MTAALVHAGLAPSPALAPSPTLAPAGTVYQGGPITPHQIAIACGTNSAYVDVTSYVEFGEQVTYTYGRANQFQDAAPGTFTFTLNNSDGRFTPANPFSPLAVKIVEGMGVSWLLGTRLIHTSILSIEIPPAEDQWNQIVIHCDDMLGNAGRFGLTNLPDQLTAYSGMLAQWRLDESSGASGSVETNQSLLGSFNLSLSNPSSTGSGISYGIPQVPGLPGTAVTLTAAPGETVTYGTTHGAKQVQTVYPYDRISTTTPTSSQPNFGWWGFWVYPGSNITFSVTPHWAAYAAGYTDSIKVKVTPGGVSLQGGTNGAGYVAYTIAELRVPHFVFFHSYAVYQSGPGYFANALALYVDGHFRGTTFMKSSNPAIGAGGYQPVSQQLYDGTAMQPVEVNFSVTNPASATTPLSGTVQRVTHTMQGVMLEQNALYNTLDQRRAVIDTIDGTISSATYAPAGGMPSTPIGYPDVSSRSALDVYNDIVRSVAGHIFCTTTGTFLNPIEQIQLRTRDRPQTPKVSFDVSTEGTGVPTFIRDLTNVIEAIDVQSPNLTVTVTDPTVAAITTRFLKSGQQDTVLMTDPAEVRAWGMDRINRTKNIGINIPTFTVDAVTTPTDRSADLLSLLPGDRVRLTGLPAARLGFSTWDGWLIAGSESHGPNTSRFGFTFAPVLPPVFTLDSDPLTNSGDIFLTAGCTATDTTLQVTSWFGDIFAPCVCTLGNAGEQIQVTAATATTLTVVRGINGSTAIPHTTGAVLEVVPVKQLAY